MKFKFILSIIFLILVTAVSAQVTEDIPIDKGIAESTLFGFEWELDDSDLENFQDTEIMFQGDEYYVHDILVLDKNSPSVETSLTSYEDDYETDVFLETMRRGIRYYYLFDDPINISKATTTNPLEINFLGKTIKITRINSDTSFTAYVGNEYFMKIGDEVIVEDRHITLDNVGSSGAVSVIVDGVQEIIPANTAEIVNGIEIYNDETFYTEPLSLRVANLIIGNPALGTFEDGDEFIGEDPYDPQWTWNIKNLNQFSSTAITQDITGIHESGPIIGIENNFIADDDSDDPAGLGDCYDLPNNYASICLDSLTVADEDYTPLTLELSAVDTTQSGNPIGEIDAKTIHFSTSEGDYITIPANSMTNPNGTLNDIDVNTDNIWLQLFDVHKLAVFYNDPLHTPSMVYLGSIDMDGITPPFFTLNYGNNLNKIKIPIYHNGPFNDLDIDFDIECVESEPEHLYTTWGFIDGEGFVSLGHNQNGEDRISGLVWAKNMFEGADIENKDEDHRTKYGILIRDPEANGAVNRVFLYIPSDQVQANVVITSYYIPLEEIPQVCEEGNIGDLEINIEDPESNQEFTIGENINNIEIEVENHGDEDKSIIVEAILYDLDNAEIVSTTQSESIQIDDGDQETFDLSLEIPANLDEDSSYILIAKAYEDGNEDDNCIQDYVTTLLISDNSILKYYIYLNTGWNLFSIQFTQNDTKTETVISDIKDNIEVIYSYRQGQWKIWRNNYPSNTLINLDEGYGYFIKLTQPAILHIEGKMGKGEPPVIPTFNVYTGWNLIGPYGTKDIPISTGLRNIDNKYSAVWTLFNNNLQSLQGTFRGLDFSEQLKRTHGYWLYMKEAGIIVPTN